MDDLNSTPEAQKGIFNFNLKDNPVGFVAFLFFALLTFGAISIFMLNTREQSSQDKLESGNKTIFKPIADNTVVYGYWAGEGSKINAANLKNGNIYELASLPANIKKVSVISPNLLIFIDKTDVSDHGKEMSVYNISAKSSETILSASDNFGIDEYVISPNKKYIALWEVSIPEGKGLSSGKSRVFTVSMENPNVKNLIYDENITETKYAHYPLAITDDGKVFMDTFEPNSGAGWANGMSVSDLSGSQKQNIEPMIAGTYGTQPRLSPDGRYLAFAGYSNNLLGGVSGISEDDGFRRAILSPNTVATLDTSTLQVETIVKSAIGTIYPEVSWDNISGKILYSAVSKDTSKSGQYLFNLATNTPVKIDDIAEDGITDTYAVISSMSDGKLLAGQQDLDQSTLGNLGEGYAKSLSELGVYDTREKKLIPFSVDSPLVQYIDIFSSSYFPESLPKVAVVSDGSGRKSTNQLQLQTFTIKPTLEPQRLSLQSDIISTASARPKGKCRDIAAAQCNELNGTNVDAVKAKEDYEKRMKERYSGRPKDPQSPEEPISAFDACFDQNFKTETDECPDSPLYLYGDVGKNVSVEIGTEVINSNAPYKDEYRGVLTGDGGISIYGVNYKSLDYVYVSAIKKLPRLEYGKNVKSIDLGKVIREYGKKLGLNSNEIEDTIESIGVIDSPYVFVSFFNEEVSRAILPISFDPKPDVYRNIVFYIKPIYKPIVVKTPVFEKYPERRGFTAIEVSYLID